MSFDLMPAATELVLFVGCLALLLLGAIRGDQDGPRLLTPLAVLTMLVAAIIALAHDKTRLLAFDGHYVLDSYAEFLKVLILLGAAGALLLAGQFLRDEKVERYEYPLLVLFSSLGMCMMVSANSFLALYMSLELQSLPIYVLAAVHRDNLRSSEAGLKYFVLGALASGMLLYGCSLVYGFSGTLNFDLLADIWTGEQALPLGGLIGLVFVLSGLAFKMAAVPFHMWTPDVYEGAPSPVTAFIAGAPKVAAVGLLVRVLMGPFGAWIPQWQQVVVVLAVASMALGSFAAIGQLNFKRLMAYSGIGNIGFALVGVAAGTEAGVDAALVYMMIYLIMTLGTFACILQMRRDGQYVESIGELAGLSRERPMMAAVLGVCMFSLAGIPPLAGFIAKFYVFRAAVDAGLVWLAVVGVLLSVVGAYYYLRIVKIMYFDEPVVPFDRTVSPTVGIVGGVCAALLLFFLVPFLAAPMLTSASAAAAALMR
ncbi:MAG: NADH-quinone oxidoreductase subunit NuoN [Geminicoccaceae bacterium]